MNKFKNPFPSFSLYQVGGCVRDELLGLQSNDVDWVVVGATPEDMLALGYSQVGKDFPVFLHPISGEEYALARVERSPSGFFVGVEQVSLEDDLSRRDLSINAMARAPDGTLIDPHGGVRDLRERVARHVGPAFSDDPVRVLRVGRFIARFSLVCHPDTFLLCREIVASGRLADIPSERIRNEAQKAAAYENSFAFWDFLCETKASLYLSPSVHNVFHKENFERQAFQNLLSAPDSLTRAGAFFGSYDEKAAQEFSERYASGEEARIILGSARLLREGARLFDSENFIAIMEKNDAFRRQEAAFEMLRIARDVAQAKNENFQYDRLSMALSASLSVSFLETCGNLKGIEARDAFKKARAEAAVPCLSEKRNIDFRPF